MKPLIEIITKRGEASYQPHKPNQPTMSQLQSRRDKVQRLTNQALKDKMHHKYMQGVYLLNQIAIRELQLFSNRINKLNNAN
jgi:hypothetical protein